jgi:hypothetical protein
MPRGSRPAQSSPWLVKELAEPGQEVQSALDRVSRGVDPEAPVGVEQVAAVQNCERVDVLGPHRIRPENEPVVRGPPVERHCHHLGISVRFVSSNGQGQSTLRGRVRRLMHRGLRRRSIDGVSLQDMSPSPRPVYV